MPCGASLLACQLSTCCFSFRLRLAGSVAQAGSGTVDLQAKQHAAKKALILVFGSMLKEGSGGHYTFSSACGDPLIEQILKPQIILGTGCSDTDTHDTSQATPSEIAT